MLLRDDLSTPVSILRPQEVHDGQGPHDVNDEAADDGGPVEGRAGEEVAASTRVGEEKNLGVAVGEKVDEAFRKNCYPHHFDLFFHGRNLRLVLELNLPAGSRRDQVVCLAPLSFEELLRTRLDHTREHNKHHRDNAVAEVGNHERQRFAQPINLSRKVHPLPDSQSCKQTHADVHQRFERFFHPLQIHHFSDSVGCEELLQHVQEY